MEHPGVSPDVDAVIAWVDGGDPAHRRKLHACLHGGEAEGIASVAADPTRFSDCGEIDYCVASLLRFAPWLRTIHIVTDAQTPSLMERLKGTPFEDRVRVVDHTVIFAGYEQFLPTFSSLSIEAMLWRIPGLAERFIYLNDDFQIIRPVAIEDFFRDDGVVLRGKWRATRMRRLGQRLKAALPAWLRFGRKADPASNHSAQQLTAAMVGFTDRYFQVPHCPHPMRRSKLKTFLDAHPRELAANLAFRLRAPEQFLATALADHLEIGAGTAIIDNRLGTLRLKPARQGLQSLLRQLDKADADQRIAFACIQSLDQASEEGRALVFDWLDRRVGKLDQLPAQ